MLNTEEKILMTEAELIEFAKMIWREAADGKKPTVGDVGIIKNYTHELMCDHYWRDR